MTPEQEREDSVSELDFTQRAFETFYDAVDDPYFCDQDLKVIYATLKDKIQVVSFGDYLRRYIYEKAEMDGDYKSIPVVEYQEILCSEFAERQVPASFSPGTTRLKNLARKWLEQKSASRNTVLLLGFGLGMTADDVDSFLTKALKEQRLNAKDPFEVVCWFCYKNRLSYLKFEQLWEKYTETGAAESPEAGMLDSTFEFKQRMLSISDENQLMRYLRHLPIAPGTIRQSVMARKQFDRIYAETCDWVAEVLTETERNSSEIAVERMRDKLDKNDRLYDYEKQQMLEKAGKNYHRYHKTEIRAADVEQVAFASVPKDRNGNLLPIKASALNDRFAGSRLSRQHLSDILSGKAPITRYDLITLNFLAFSRRTDEFDSALKRYAAFIDSTNNILEKSDMAPMYPVNPYESFLMMCVLSDDPVGTFSDVWEMSYTEK